MLSATAGLMVEDDVGTLVVLETLRKALLVPAVAKHRGRIVKLMVDGALVEFPSVADAVECAVFVQQAMAARNADTPADIPIVFRVGVNLGDIVIEGTNIYGDGVVAVHGVSIALAYRAFAISQRCYRYAPLLDRLV